MKQITHLILISVLIGPHISLAEEYLEQLRQERLQTQELETAEANKATLFIVPTNKLRAALKNIRFKLASEMKNMSVSGLYLDGYRKIIQRIKDSTPKNLEHPVTQACLHRLFITKHADIYPVQLVKDFEDTWMQYSVFMSVCPDESSLHTLCETELKKQVKSVMGVDIGRRNPLRTYLTRVCANVVPK